MDCVDEGRVGGGDHGAAGEGGGDHGGGGVALGDHEPGVHGEDGHLQHLLLPWCPCCHAHVHHHTHSPV